MRVIDQSVTVLYPYCKMDAEDGLQLVEYAARNCYRSQDKITTISYDKFIRGLMDRKHYSPLEFCDVALELVTSRDVMAELTRHRHASFAIQSQRYVKDNKDGQIRFVKPCFYGKNEKLTMAWEAGCRSSEAAYDAMISSGASAQDARKVLNNSVATVICMKANLREWLHIIELRDSTRAYPEMQALARMIHDKLREFYPTVFPPDEG